MRLPRSPHTRRGNILVSVTSFVCSVAIAISPLYQEKNRWDSALLWVGVLLLVAYGCLHAAWAWREKS